ncbi:MAG: N-acetylneuraminate synthase [Selenomonadaceae bacterium]|nr:N-acetylneuraminate synthase [Selenomonadaceae bacterium]
MSKVLIIAEAGVNHNGDVELAHRLIDEAKAAGADVVKFQTARAELVTSRFAEKAAYQKVTTDADETQLDMIRKLLLPFEDFIALKRHCDEIGIEFLSTPFEPTALRFLVDECGLSLLKIPSGEITNAPLLLEAARSGSDIILSTGMSTLGEIETALGVLAFGYLRQGTPTSERDPVEAYAEAQRKGVLRDRIRLLHCTTEYPAPFDEVNLSAMATMRRAFDLPVGYSDHTPGIAVALGAAALGAVIIEKHFTLDKNLPGPDHKASLEPNELSLMVEGIRQIELAIGDGVKVPTEREYGNLKIARKSLVARRAIAAGETFTEENLTIKRPATGISPMRYWSMLGQTAARDYDEDEIL